MTSPLYEIEVPGCHISVLIIPNVKFQPLIFFRFTYRADKYNDDAIKQVLDFRPVYVEEYNKLHAGSSEEDAGKYSTTVKPLI